MAIKRGLALEGGGAKGAYAFGCLLALRERGITFDAVAGTSVGALNGLLWATESVEEERTTWANLSQEVVYPRTRSRLTSLLVVFFHLYSAWIRQLRFPLPAALSALFSVMYLSETLIIWAAYGWIVWDWVLPPLEDLKGPSPPRVVGARPRT